VRARPNAVPWANAILYEAAPSIERSFGRGFLPAGEQLYPAGPDEHGTGGFSAVFPCEKPGLVMKVTVDGSEAFLAEVLRKLGPMPGLPHYEREPMRLERDGEPVWIVWRKDLPPPNLAREMDARGAQVRDRYPEDRLWASKHGGRQYAWEQYAKAREAVGLTEESDLGHAKNAGLTVSSIFTASEAHGSGIEGAQRSLRGQMAWAVRVFEPTYRDEMWGWRWTAKNERELSTSERSALELLGFEFIMNRLARGKLVPEMAQSLLRLVEEGVLVGDVNPDNVSAGVRPYTLFDGGFTLPLDPKWNGLWHSVGPRIERWWDHEARGNAFGVWVGYPKRERIRWR